ncbi:adenylosuccinate lyase [uncultured Mediterranean phage]|nr:adenylosuccinate lyase [uncultured Mediterranean phage]
MLNTDNFVLKQQELQKQEENNETTERQKRQNQVFNYAKNKEQKGKYISREIEKSLISISPIDGRYSEQTNKLQPFFSEFALFRYRLKIEIEYFIFLIRTGLPELHQINHAENTTNLRAIYKNFDLNDCFIVKKIEFEIKHDIKAVEYFIRIKLEELSLSKFNSFIHFGLTSQDINNTSTTLSIKHCIEIIIYPYIDNIKLTLQNYANDWKDVVMLGHTHGQPAVPTTVGKEFKVFWNRLHKIHVDLYATEYYGKFGGAVGNLNAHYAAYPDIDWFSKMNEFIQKFGLIRDPITTQIDNYENITCIFDRLKRINTTLIDLNQDIWMYISMRYFSQRIIPGEVGSSTMPHKVNPINFENSEGNLMIANTLLEFMARKLPVSRMQRDLTDSTVLRNLGVIFGHIVVAYDSLLKGLEKIEINRTVLQKDLVENNIVIIEGIQTIMRKHGYDNAYEKCKSLSRTSETISQYKLESFITTLDVTNECKEQLRKITIENYVGNSEKLVSCDGMD